VSVSYGLIEKLLLKDIPFVIDKIYYMYYSKYVDINTLFNYYIFVKYYILNIFPFFLLIKCAR